MLNPKDNPLALHIVNTGSERWGTLVFIKKEAAGWGLVLEIHVSVCICVYLYVQMHTLHIVV